MEGRNKRGQDRSCKIVYYLIPAFVSNLSIILLKKKKSNRSDLTELILDLIVFTGTGTPLITNKGSQSNLTEVRRRAQARLITRATRLACTRIPCFFFQKDRIGIPSVITSVTQREAQDAQPIYRRWKIYQAKTQYFSNTKEKAQHRRLGNQ